jgi:undecaprenyl-diphosphatase
MPLKHDWKYVSHTTYRAFKAMPLWFWMVFLAFLGVSVAILLPRELMILKIVRHDSPSWSASGLKFLSTVGEFHYLNLIGTFLLLVWGFLAKSQRIQRIGLSFLLAGILAGVTVQVVKPLVGRPRPSHCFSRNLGPLDFAGPTLNRRFYSYPSGHTATTVAACTVVAIGFPRLIVPCILLSLGMAWSRMFQNAHFPIDTVHGGGLGLIFGYVSMGWTRQRSPAEALGVAADFPESAVVLPKVDEG